jgi:hypothetical protein
MPALCPPLFEVVLTAMLRSVPPAVQVDVVYGLHSLSVTSYDVLIWNPQSSLKGIFHEYFVLEVAGRLTYGCEVLIATT